MGQQDPDGYSSSEVCEAIGLARTTLDVWLLRRYLDLSSGPGTGRTRRFTADEVILVAIVAELTKLGLNVAAAAHAANLLSRLAADGHKPPVQEDGWVLVIAPSSAPAGIDAPSLSPLAMIKPKTLAALRRFIREKHGDPAAVVIADVSAIVRRTIDRLRLGKPKKKGRPRKS